MKEKLKMKNYLFLAVISAFLMSGSARATHDVVSYEAQVVSAQNPYQVACVSGKVHYNDVVNACDAGPVKAQHVVVAEAGHCSQNELVRFVNNRRVNVVVRRGILRQVGFTGYNQAVANCDRVVRRRGVVVSRRRVRSSGVLFGFLTGRNARAVKVVVDSCR